MTRVRLIVTGRVEELALGESLQRVFPQLSFETVYKNGFTSSPTKKTLAYPETLKAENLVRELLAAGDTTPTGGEPFDYAIVFEDVELCNQPDPTGAIRNDHVGCWDSVVDYFCQSVRYLLRRMEEPSEPEVQAKGKQAKWKRLHSKEDKQRFLQERCSFHLVAPMIESLFFADPAALQNAALIHPSQFQAALCDVDLFAVSDPSYPGWPTRAEWVNVPSWFGEYMKARHPKDYLDFLLYDKERSFGRAYKEKQQGRAMLSALNWKEVLAHDSFARLARSLLVDLAEMAGVTRDPLYSWIYQGQTHPLTARKTKGILRNV